MDPADILDDARARLAATLPPGSVEHGEALAGVFDPVLFALIVGIAEAAERASDGDEIANKVIPLSHAYTCAVGAVTEAIG